MRICFVVQRYGAEVAGGAEQHCRAFAERLAARGHGVEVLTSRAVDYLDWADHYPAGSHEENGVLVHRLGVRAPRDLSLFGPLDYRVVGRRPKAPLFLQEEWLRLQGPEMVGFESWLSANASRFDVVSFFTYLYLPTALGLRHASPWAPVLVHPTAHEEPHLRLDLFRLALAHADGFAYGTAEEAELCRRLFELSRPSEVVGIGVEPFQGGDAEAFRRRFGLRDRPYLLYLGRVDLHKGVAELVDFFSTYKERHPASDLRLVVAGKEVMRLPEVAGVVKTGYLDGASLRGALAGALAIVVPSYFESFSMALTEAWAAGLPALVQGRTAVLRGQADRSGGGIAYVGFAEFEAALEELEASPGLARALGQAGKRFVESNYAWGAVLDRYEQLILRVMLRFSSRARRGALSRRA